MQKIVTHSGGFHADDVFAIATFQLLLGTENVEVVRSRDDEVIASADYVVDVGNVYNHEQKRYDHHQTGAPVRENGIPYAGFGLVWRHYGVEVCGSDEVAAAIEAQLVLPIDAGDNGISLYSLNEYEVSPFELYQMVGLFGPMWGSDESKDEGFFEAVNWACGVLKRMIDKERAKLAMKELVKETHDAAEDKSMLVFEVPVSMVACIEYEDVQVVVCPDDPKSNDNWTATCVRKGFDTFEGRVVFPEQWAGLRDEELARVSGISDAIFCHKAQFFFVAKSKESAIKAAKMAG